MHLIPAKQEELVWDVKVGGHFGYNSHEVVGVQDSEREQDKQQDGNPGFQESRLFSSEGRVLWETVLGSKGIQESWWVFFPKNCLF